MITLAALQSEENGFAVVRIGCPRLSLGMANRLAVYRTSKTLPPRIGLIWYCHDSSRPHVAVVARECCNRQAKVRSKSLLNYGVVDAARSVSVAPAPPKFLTTARRNFSVGDQELHSRPGPYRRGTKSVPTGWYSISTWRKMPFDATLEVWCMVLVSW